MKKLILLNFVAFLLMWMACAAETEANRTQGASTMEITIHITSETGEYSLTATLYDNSSSRALFELLQKGDVTIDMSDYGNFEKVGDLPVTLPRNDTPTDTDSGDIILYQGKRFVIYYDKNSWNFTPLGKVQGVSKAELKNILGKGNVKATLSIGE